MYLDVGDCHKSKVEIASMTSPIELRAELRTLVKLRPDAAADFLLLMTTALSARWCPTTTNSPAISSH